MDFAAYSSACNQQSRDRFLHPFDGQRKPCTSEIASSGTDDQSRLEGGSRGIAPLTRRAFACVCRSVLAMGRHVVFHHRQWRGGIPRDLALSLGGCGCWMIYRC
ncbi:hypothetical protein DPMN_138816 [Dreissena polymorpha]|uniref:Uncharacterized protein n=1 Tax=Dreissena polymorpha TaxID=45954 RepID=A0A9D4JHM2_DREPO|nr:hypothetical protein DPMN_138816 [Dreissena polymorpha]